MIEAEPSRPEQGAEESDLALVRANGTLPSGTASLVGAVEVDDSQKTRLRVERLVDSVEGFEVGGNLSREQIKSIDFCVKWDRFSLRHSPSIKSSSSSPTPNFLSDRHFRQPIPAT